MIVTKLQRLGIDTDIMGIKVKAMIYVKARVACRLWVWWSMGGERLYNTGSECKSEYNVQSMHNLTCLVLAEVV